MMTTKMIFPNHVILPKFGPNRGLDMANNRRVSFAEKAHVRLFDKDDDWANSRDGRWRKSLGAAMGIGDSGGSDSGQLQSVFGSEDGQISTMFQMPDLSSVRRTRQTSFEVKVKGSPQADSHEKVASPARSAPIASIGPLDVQSRLDDSPNIDRRRRSTASPRNSASRKLSSMALGTAGSPMVSGRSSALAGSPSFSRRHSLAGSPSLSRRQSALAAHLRSPLRRDSLAAFVVSGKAGAGNRLWQIGGDDESVMADESMDLIENEVYDRLTGEVGNGDVSMDVDSPSFSEQISKLYHISLAKEFLLFHGHQKHIRTPMLQLFLLFQKRRKDNQGKCRSFQLNLPGFLKH
ncbi:hypothetical protein BJ742DRAFT_71009 [Cladochytrium replicatum]|nr:hypothetical protein BJ742DRAFT_71009 [Cladochytrium replicatum]